MHEINIFCLVGDDCNSNNHCLFNWWRLHRQRPLSVQLVTTTTIVCSVGDDYNHCLFSRWRLQPLSVQLVTTTTTIVCSVGDDYKNHCLFSSWRLQQPLSVHWWRLQQPLSVHWWLQQPLSVELVTTTKTIVCSIGDECNNHCLFSWWRIQQPLSVQLLTTTATVCTWKDRCCSCRSGNPSCSWEHPCE